jgi:hypothetical protein
MTTEPLLIDDLSFLVKGGGLHIIETLCVSLTDVEFNGLKATQGGAIYFEQSLNTLVALQDMTQNQQQATTSFKRLTFVGCNATYTGGAVHLQDPVNMNISDSNFS